MNEKASNLKNFFQSFLSERKKYILIYLVCLLFFTFTFFSVDDYLHPKIEFLTLFGLFIAGMIVLSYSFKNRCETHKIAFVIIILFGLFLVFLSPTLGGHDELEHFARAELTSTGVIFPEYIDGEGYSISNYISNFYGDDAKTFANTNHYNEKIDYSKGMMSSVFSQNPFYGYIVQAIGILIAKLFDLGIIWTVWLGRLANLIFYGVIVSLAIKKAPIYKVPLLVLSCMPICIFQAASISIDAFIYAFGILAIGYFIYMYKSKEKVKRKDLLIFFISCLLIGIIKIPFILLVFLILLIPKSKFNSINDYNLSRIGIIIAILITIMYTLIFSMGQLDKSSRAIYYIENNVSASGQVKFMLNNPLEGIVPFLQIANSIPDLFISLNLLHFFQIPNVQIFNLLFFTYFVIFSIFYPNKLNLSNKKRIIPLGIFILVYFGTMFIQYLTWTPVGHPQILGVSARYFIPIIPLLPMILNINKIENSKNLDLIILSMTIAFLAGFVLLIVAPLY
ncbi:DUF2142 domain-containing protein [Methanobrevibacter sp. DSM 116169]|uniref:DUF2142 domain-containing protein n=1 Tax=Methanobrevibacter sp. DSM 116169 TaxID=3242727 RepID=UPI0038FC485A